MWIAEANFKWILESHYSENILSKFTTWENIRTESYYTSVGTHKDDLSFEIDGHPIKNLVLRDNRNL
jgi:DNA replication and repair protein RecF